jgi:VWFA-related protein
VKAKASGAPLQHEVTVTLKLIQVFVTDANGKPALDLERSDFVITDNGKPQTITDFEKHALALPAPGPAAPAAPVAAPAPSPKPEVPLLSRKFIFLIDYVRNGLEGVRKAKAAALEFLDTKAGPDDEAALFTLSPISGLTLHEYLTKDHDKIRAKLKKLREFRRPATSPAGAHGHGAPQRAGFCRGHGGHAGPTSAPVRGYQRNGPRRCGPSPARRISSFYHGLRERRRSSGQAQQRSFRDDGGP